MRLIVAEPRVLDSICVLSVTLVMDKQHILDEIRRTAILNGGVPLGRARFQAETGIAQSDWYGKYWRTWGDAVTEAGYTANQLQRAFDEDHVVGKLVELIRELGRYPVVADLRMKARADPEFPSHNVFERIGTKNVRARKVVAYCQDREGLEDVANICRPLAGMTSDITAIPVTKTEVIGFVYLMKSGRFYKIGRTNSAGRREYELGIQLPEKCSMVHQIKTDDPVGIEEYWHKRFRDSRRNGEWFELSAEDVAIFKRRRFM